jgi:hypothetical protein
MPFNPERTRKMAKWQKGRENLLGMGKTPDEADALTIALFFDGDEAKFKEAVAEDEAKRFGSLGEIVGRFRSQIDVNPAAPKHSEAPNAQKVAILALADLRRLRDRYAGAVADATEIVKRCEDGIPDGCQILGSEKVSTQNRTTKNGGGPWNGEILNEDHLDAVKAAIAPLSDRIALIDEFIEAFGSTNSLIIG